MAGRWQPYPNEPRVRDLTDCLHDLQERTIAALATKDEAGAQRLLHELDTVRGRLDQLTAALLQDHALAPHWVEHTETGAEIGAAGCLECGNNIPSGESACSYCGWTYQADG